MFENVSEKVRNICIFFFWFLSIAVVVAGVLVTNIQELYYFFEEEEVIITVVVAVILLVIILYINTLSVLVLAEIGANTIAIRDLLSSPENVSKINTNSTPMAKTEIKSNETNTLPSFYTRI